MGGMLTYPVTSKMLVREGNSLYRVGRTDMQGYRTNMEDAMTVLLGMGKGREDWAFFGVFDGHAGTRASEYLGQMLHLRICELADPFDAAAVSAAVCKLDADFCSDPERRNDGSTCVFAIVRPVNEDKTEFEILVSNTGDSRVIIIRKDASGENAMESMTEDHKPETPAEKARILAAGGTVAMNRTDGQLAMSRAIGDYQYKANPDLEQVSQKVIPHPDIRVSKVRPGDTIVVMCDGIVEQMTNERAAECVTKSMKEHNDPALACADVFSASLVAGSKDNHTAIIAVIEDGSDFGPRTEFVAGPYHPYQRNTQFANAYIADAARYGLEGDRLFELARKTEEKFGPFEEPQEPQDQGRYLRLLQHIQASYNLQNMQLHDDDDDNDDDEDGGGGTGIDIRAILNASRAASGAGENNTGGADAADES